MADTDTALSDRQRLARAFARLGPLGYYTDMGTLCCGPCTYAHLNSLMDEAGRCGVERRAVYWDEQSGEYAFGTKRSNTLQTTLYLSWQGDVFAIQDALEAEGLRVVLPLTSDKEIRVLPPAERRHDWTSDGYLAGEDQACEVCGVPKNQHTPDKKAAR